MADTAATPNTGTPVFAPDGSVRSIPDVQIQDAISSGGKLAVQMKAPDGSLRYVPHDQVRDAQLAGGQVSPVQGAPNAPKPAEGFWHSLGSVFGLTPEAYKAAQEKAANMNPIQEALSATAPPNPIDLAKSAGTAVKNEFQKGSQEGQQSLDSLQHGDIKGFIAHQIGQVGHAGATLAAPVTGENLSKAGEQFGEGDIKGGLGTATGVIAPVAAHAVLPSKATALKVLDKGTDILADTLIDPRKTFTETIPKAAGRAVKRMIGQPPAPARTIGQPPLQLGTGDIITPPPADTSGSVPYTPPPVAATSRAERLGLMLPAAPPEAIPMPAVPMTPEPEGLFPAASTVVYDPVTGQSRTQFLTSIAEPGQGFTPQDSQLLNDPRGAFAKYAQEHDLGGLADPMAPANPSPITNPIKPQSTLPAWANEVMGWERNDPQHLFNQLDEHDFLNHQRQEEIQQWIEQHNKQPEPFASNGLKTSDGTQRTLGQPPTQTAAPQVPTDENTEDLLAQSIEQANAKKAAAVNGNGASRAIGQPPVSDKIGGAKVLKGDVPLTGPVSPRPAEVSRLQAELKKATDPKERADIQQAIDYLTAGIEGKPFNLPEQAKVENLPESQPRTHQPAPYTRGQEPAPQGSASAPVAASALKPGEAGTVKTADLNLDPKRFQFKLGTDSSGVTNQFKDTQKFNPDLAGVVSVWTDPADGKTYVVNGHHRVELAQRTGQPSMLVRQLSASSAESARAQGALINIAEGRGTAVDAAKFFRDSTLTPADLAKDGISLSEAKVQDGMALSKLDPSIFDKVATGQMPEQRGIAIGQATADPAQQEAIVKLIDKQEAKGRKVNNDTVAELSRFVANSGNRTIEQGGLFGANQEIHSLALDKAELSAGIKQQLAKEKRVFGAVADQGKAQILSRVKDQAIKPGENAQISQQAGQAIELFDKLSVTKGPINDILENVAKERASGYLKPEEARAKAYDAIRAELQKTLGGGENGSGTGSQTRPGFPAPPKR